LAASQTASCSSAVKKDDMKCKNRICMCVFLVLWGDFFFLLLWKVHRSVSDLQWGMSAFYGSSLDFPFIIILFFTKPAKGIKTWMCTWQLSPETWWSCHARHVPLMRRHPESSQMETFFHWIWVVHEASMPTYMLTPRPDGWCSVSWRWNFWKYHSQIKISWSTQTWIFFIAFPDLHTQILISLYKTIMLKINKVYRAMSARFTITPSGPS